MKSEVKFEDWEKVDLRVGEITEVRDKIKVDIGEDVLESDEKLDVKKGDKIVVGVMGDKLIFPLVGDSIIVPETDIEVGSCVG